MDNSKEEMLLLQGSRMSQEAAYSRDLVPVSVTSLSDEGQGAALTAGAAPGRTTAAQDDTEDASRMNIEVSPPSVNIEVSPPSVLKESDEVGVNTPQGDSCTQIATRPANANESWVNLVEEEEKGTVDKPTYSMDVDDEEVIATSTKRKANRTIGSDLSDSDESKDLESRIQAAKLLGKLGPRKSKLFRVIANFKKDGQDPDGSNADVTHITDGEGVQNKKVGRPKKVVKAIDPILAENEIHSKIGQAPDGMEKEVLDNMTASDISAQALDFIQDIDVIRTKCGRMQGSLSGELKNRLACLQDFIRVLHNKADSTGDPKFLRTKITKLTVELEKEKSRHKREEEKRLRELSELRDTISELKKENKNIREEMRRIRLSIEKKDEAILPTNLQSRVETTLKTNSTTNLRANPITNCTKLTKSKNLPENSPILMSQDKSSSRGWSPSDNPANSGFRWSLQNRLSQARSVEKEDEGPWPIFGEQWPSMPSTSRDESKMESKKRKLEDKESPTPLPQRIPREYSKKSDPTGPTKGIRVKENIQLVPPRADRKNTRQEEEWKEIGKNGRIKKGIRDKQPNRTKKEDKQAADIKKEKKKLPKTAAISIKGKSSDFSYAEALKRVRTGISLQELEIKTPKVRKGMNGATIIEISGADNIDKANKLASEISKLLSEEAVISRPNVKGEVRLFGVEESVTPDEIREVVAAEGECSFEEVKVGRIGRTRSGNSVVWVQCPRNSTVTLAEKKRIPIGWSMVRIEMIKARPLQCHKCWRIGHVKEKCKSNKNYLGHCFKCGMEGHIAPKCTNKPKCRICLDLGLKGDHRMGSQICTAIKIPANIPNNDVQRKQPTTSLNTDSSAERRTADDIVPMDE